VNATSLIPTPVRANALLLVVCLAQFMVILDVAIVNIALPSIRDDLGFSATGLQWVVNAYTLTFAGFLMLGGRLADLLGRRRVLLVSTAAFALSSVLCAFASSRGLLIGARAVQGLAGAAMSPATMSIITTSFAEGPERNRALGAWVMMGAIGASSGALFGGLLTQTLGWPAIFAVNAPLGLLTIVLGLRVIPAGLPARAGGTSTCSARRSSPPGSSASPTASSAPTYSAGAPPASCFRSSPPPGCSRPSPSSRLVSRASRSCRCRSSVSASCARRTWSSSCSTGRSSRCSTSWRSMCSACSATARSRPA
jgi:MFS family permease